MKTGEVVKTAIALFPNDSEHGFDHQKALQWIKDAPRKQLRDKGNGLGMPLSEITLSEAQSRFLQGRLPEKEALVEAALTHTIDALKKHAEIKVPSFIELGKVIKGIHL